MNNQQFRRLILDNNAQLDEDSHVSATSVDGNSLRQSSRTEKSSLVTASRPRINLSAIRGSTSRSNAAGNLFVRQLEEHKSQKGGLRQGKHRTSAAPRGTKLAAGYIDRAQELRNRKDREGGEPVSNPDAYQRIQALEELVRIGQIDHQTFTQLKEQILSAGKEATPRIIKGLDRELLARVRAGDDVFSEPPEDEGYCGEQMSSENAEAKLDGLLEQSVMAVEREKKDKRGIKVDTSAASRKRTRDDIIRELKQARVKAAEEAKASRPALSSHFKKISVVPKPGTSQVIIDERGREVLIIVDAKGNVKRKLRKRSQEYRPEHAQSLPMPDKRAKPLGMDIPLGTRTEPGAQRESEDIFSDAGTEYDPLGDIKNETGSDDSDQSLEVEDTTNSHQTTTDSNARANERDFKQPDLTSSVERIERRNYFTGKLDEDDERHRRRFKEDIQQSISTAIKQISSAIVVENDASGGGVQTYRQDHENDRLSRIKARIMERDHDEDDIDDQEDEEDRPVKLSKWRNDMTRANKDGLDHITKKGGWSKPRKAKRKDGDRNDANIVLKALESRRGG